jgi:hypothetical protein
MSRRITGVIFIAISAWLYSTRFITAAIWGSGFSSWSADKFKNLLGYVDQDLTIWCIAALVIGLIYLVWGEFSEKRR